MGAAEAGSGGDGLTAWVVTPVYRDVRSFTILRRRLREVLAAEAAAEEVRFVVLDDTAGQDEEIEQLEGTSDVEVVRPPFNLGHQRAIVFGMRKLLPRLADDDVVVTIDADGEDQPEDLPRLLAALGEDGERRRAVAVARRTKRREPLGFKIGYQFFKLLFRGLTGTTVRSGNYAAWPAPLARRTITHPVFDLSYSSAILALDLPISQVPCERGERYEGRSKMTYSRLALHGLRMMMPFTDRIAVRALAVFVASLCFGVLLALVVVVLKLLGETIPGWASFTVLAAVIVSLVALGNFVTLFVIFSQNRAVSLANIEELGEP